MYILFLLVTFFLLGAYLLREQFPIEFFRRRERSMAGVVAAATFISGLLLTARASGFGPKLGIFIGMLGLVTLIARQQSDTVLHALDRLGIHWNPFAQRYFSPILGWPLFFMGVIIATPPALWVDLIGVAIIYGIAVVYARRKKAKIEP